jgi:hypothetical protein
MQTIIRIAAGNGFGRVLVARGGILSTPAMSAVIRRRKTLGGLVLSASHNPGGPDEDFGIKYNVPNGGPAPEQVTERIFRETLKIERYLTVDIPDVEIDREGSLKVASTEVVVFDPLADYTAVMEGLFDFEALRAYFRSGFRTLCAAHIRATPGGACGHSAQWRTSQRFRRASSGSKSGVRGGPGAPAFCGRRAGFRSSLRCRWGSQYDFGPQGFCKPGRLVGSDCRTRGACHPGLSRWSQRRCAIAAHQHGRGSGSGGDRHKVL